MCDGSSHGEGLSLRCLHILYRPLCAVPVNFIPIKNCYHPSSTRAGSSSTCRTCRVWQPRYLRMAMPYVVPGATRYTDQLSMGLMDLPDDADYTWSTNWDPSDPGTSSSWDNQSPQTMEGYTPDVAGPSRGRSIGKTTPPRSESASSFASNVSCRSCSATFARPDVRKRHEDEKHSRRTKKVTCGSPAVGWGCGKKYANERSLKDHWSKEAKDGTGRICKAAKERVTASFPPKDDLIKQSS